MKKWTEVLELLSDGEWQGSTQLQRDLELSAFQTKLLTNFLVECGFCNYRMNGTVMEIRLRADVLKFLENLDKQMVKTEKETSH